MKRPRSVTLAAVLQLLLATAFGISVVTALLYGPAAQQAAENEMRRQGLPPGALTGESLRFDEGLAGTAPALAIALILITLAMLNLNGRRLGRLLTWIFQPLLAIAGAILVSGQVFLAQGITKAFAQSDNQALHAVDVEALVKAAAAEFPNWYPIESWAKLILVTLGSVLIVVLLALPTARAFFRQPTRESADASAHAS